MSTLAAIAMGSMLLLGTTSPAQASAALFQSLCYGCHDGIKHPAGLVYNAAGNAAIITAVNDLGMGAAGSPADFASIAAYLDSVKPAIILAPVPHDSPGRSINLSDIKVSAAEKHAFLKIITNVVTVSAPAKGTVTYLVANGFSAPSIAIYTPFPGQSGIDTWTYQGIGERGNTTVRTASVNIAAGTTAPSLTPDLNQHGLTGSWYEPATNGQGVEVEVFADLIGPGTGRIQVSWFTYDMNPAGGPERQRWYTMGGNIATGAASVDLPIYQNVGGNFNAPPITNSTQVGTATLRLADCEHGTLDYAFTDGSGRSGRIDLTRLTKNVTCVASGARPVNADFALSGNWYDPATSGQGITVEINPLSPVAFFAWYTYAPGGAAAGAAGQRWYTGQSGYVAGTRTLAMKLYATSGGLFDAPTPVPASVEVGTATLTFQSCLAATLDYTFTGGSSAGASGRIMLTKIAPTSPGCLM